jgi:DNA-binding beta-propeller fold protein YncE
VLDLHSGKLLHTVAGIGIPHAVLYRRGVNRLFVTDGGQGGVHVYNATTYAQEAFIKLKLDSDSIAYDPATHRLYVVNGGGDAHETHSMVSVIDTDRDVKIADIRLPGRTVEQLTIDPGSDRLYAANPSEGEVDVIDRKTNAITARWKVRLGRGGSAVALDRATHRLYVGCRSGVIVVFDTRTGKELRTLAIAGGIDDLIFNPATGKLYAPCGAGSLIEYQIVNASQERKVATVATAPGAKNLVFDAASGRLYTVEPPAKGRAGRVLVYRTSGAGN